MHWSMSGDLQRMGEENISSLLKIKSITDQTDGVLENEGEEEGVLEPSHDLKAEDLCCGRVLTL